MPRHQLARAPRLRRPTRAPRLRRPTRATVIAVALFLAVAAGITAAAVWGRGDVASCYTQSGGRWC